MPNTPTRNPTLHQAPQNPAWRMLTEARDFAEVCNGYWTDLARCEELGESIAYAVDADIVKLYSAPGGMSNYGKIFSDLPDEVAAATAAVLGDFIVRRMPSQLGVSAPGGLVVIPPHNTELRRIAAAIQFNAMRDAHHRPPLSEVKAAELNGILNKNPLSEVDSDQAVVLLQESGLLPDPSNSNNAADEHARLEIIPAGRFISLSAHPWFSGKDSKALLPPQLPQDIEVTTVLNEEQQQLVDLIDVWHTQLVGVYLTNIDPAPSEHKRANIFNDAEVLARLQWINERLRKSDQCKRRLVLITGTMSIFQAADLKYENLDGFARFSEAFLRHPKAFLGAKDLAQLRPPQEIAADNGIPINRFELHMADWLSVIFPSALKQQRFELLNRSSITGSTVKVEFNYPDNSTLERAWYGDGTEHRGLKSLPEFPHAHLKSFGAALTEIAHRTQAETQAQFKKDWHNFFSKSPRKFEDIINLLRQRELANIDHVYHLVDSVGAVQILQTLQKIKGVPALRFDVNAIAQEECIRLCEYLFDRKKVPDFDFIKMEEKVRQSDKSGYQARVLTAYVFACADLWFQVRPLCWAALLAAPANPNNANGDHRLGREAAYLLAVAERRLASSIEGIQNARAALEEAKKRNHNPSDLRFDSEALAQNVTEIQLNLYSNNPTEQKIEWINLVAKFLVIIEKSSLETPSIVRRWIIRQCVTNGLLLCLMAHDLQASPSQITGHARKLLKTLANEDLAPSLQLATENYQQKYADSTSDFVWLVSTAIFDSRAPRREAAKKSLQSYIAIPSKNPQNHLERIRNKKLLKTAGVIFDSD